MMYEIIGSQPLIINHGLVMLTQSEIAATNHYYSTVGPKVSVTHATVTVDCVCDCYCWYYQLV